MRHRVVLVAVVLVLAGCAAPFAPWNGTTDAQWTGDPDNHFREETLTVAIEDAAGTDRDFRPMVADALGYWERNAERYAGFPVAYELDPDAANPDVTVRFVADVADCGSEPHTAGCAPILERPGQVNRPVVVRVRANFSANSTTQVLKHELGHTLGLHHDDEPREIMRHRALLTTLPQRNATDRVMPWDDPELSVHVDHSNVSAGERDETRRQVDAALGYFADGAEGTVPDNVSFTRTDDPTAADVRIVFGDSAPCTPGAGSCGALNGRDPDGDGALETYTHLRITVAGVDTEARGWHVGYWLGRGFGLTDEELPPPLRTDDPNVRRAEWWE